MTSRRRNARGEVSLQRILAAALELAGQYGYNGTTISRITKLTDRPASSIYWYFDNKDELLAAALESSYSGRGDGPRPWSGFDPGLGLYEQLLAELQSEFITTSSEDALRLGILLALEGSASESLIQEPFRRRRNRGRAAIEAWWTAAFERRQAPDARSGARWMAILTVALLDGHYVSDVEADVDIATTRSRVVANGLVGVFDALVENPGIPATTTSTTVTPTRAPDGIEMLLSATRSLVAERGYEGATLALICQRAGVQRSSIYWRYKDKDQLVAAAVAEPFLAVLDHIRQNDDTVDAVVDKALDAVRTEPDTVKAGFALKLQRRDPATAGSVAVQEGMRTREAAMARWLGDVFTDSGDERLHEHLAWALARLLEGLMLGAFLEPPVDAAGIAPLVAIMTAKAPTRLLQA